MARRMQPQEPEQDRSKIRVFYAEVDGTTQTVQDLMRTLTAAISRPTQNAVLNVRTVQELPPVPSAEVQGDLFSDQHNEVDDELQDIPTTNAAPTAPKRKRNRNVGIEVVPDLNFIPKDKISLRDLFASKAPGNDLEQTLVLTYYMQEEMNLDWISPNHVLTAFKHVGKPVPTDIKQTIRNMKNSKAWVSFNEVERFKITTEGQNVVEHELPRAGGDKGKK